MKFKIKLKNNSFLKKHNKNIMLNILYLQDHGIAGIPIILALRDIGYFKNASVATNLSSGYLDACLRFLMHLGPRDEWIYLNSNNYFD